MIRIFEEIFTQNRFIVQNFISMPTNIFALDIGRGSYYLVIFVEERILNYESVELFNSYFDEIKRLEEGYRPDMDKNLSLIVCVKRNNLFPDPILHKVIFDIEEDPYFFKKYVLTYSDTQVDLLLENKGDTPIIKHLYLVLNDDDLFQKHKNDPYEETEYNLISKLFIKLPFLNLRKMDRELVSLKQEINNSLNPCLLSLRDDLLKVKLERDKDEIAWNKLILEYIEVENCE
ncbi:ABC-three component system middle component 1 [Paenibacillus xylanexedens]|uniref:ABC-three component system middle component 1 n=1 Tax=Paenibacillus xylanexedens TaxID=528191 RepID=UPI003D0299F1